MVTRITAETASHLQTTQNHGAVTLAVDIERWIVLYATRKAESFTLHFVLG